MPTIEQFDIAMSQPDHAVPAFRALGGGQIPSAGKEPFRISGSDAVVYQLRQTNGRVLALRCPLTDTPDPAIADRYRDLPGAESLAALRESHGAPLIGQIAYLPDGINLPGPDLRPRTLPIVAMEWVMGPTMLTAVDRACRGGDRSYLAALAETWVRLLDTLGSVGFSHGDLTAANVMVRPGAGLVLVDYDTCAWLGQSGGQIARGALGYAHPKHAAVSEPARRDDFAALVIYTSLRVLAEHPELREDHGEAPSKPDGALLFTAWDLVNPNTSQLFAALRGVVREPATLALVEALGKTCQQPPDQAPALPEIAGEYRPVRTGGPRGTGTLGTGAIRPGTGTLRPQTGALRSTGTSTLGSWPVGGPTGQSAPAATDAARDRQQRLMRFERMLQDGDERGALRFWESNQLSQDPEARSKHGSQMREFQRGDAIRRAQASAQSNDTVAFLRIWDTYGLDSHPRAEKLRPVVEVARRRRDAAVKLRQAIADDDSATVVRYWPSLQGDTLVSDLAIRVADVLQMHFGSKIAGIIAQGDDEALVAVVDEARTNGALVTSQTRREVRKASERVKTRAKLADAVATNDRIVLADLLISGRLAELGDVGPSVQRQALQALAWPHLEHGLAADNDEAILNAYDPELFDPGEGEPDSIDPQQRARIDLASRRVGWLAGVRDALKRRDTPVLQQAWERVPTGALNRLSAVERRRIERFASRDQAAAELAVALERGVDIEIMTALASVAASGASLPEAMDWAAVRGVVDRSSLAKALEEALASDPPDYGRLARLLPVARAAASDRKFSAGIDFAQFERDVLRAAHTNRLRDALAANDDAMIVAAAIPDPFGVIDQFSSRQRDRVNQAITNRRGTDRLGRGGLTGED